MVDEVRFQDLDKVKLPRAFKDALNDVVERLDLKDANLMFAFLEDDDIKHPLFESEVSLKGNIVVVKVPKSILYAPRDVIKVVLIHELLHYIAWELCLFPCSLPVIDYSKPDFHIDFLALLLLNTVSHFYVHQLARKVLDETEFDFYVHTVIAPQDLREMRGAFSDDKFKRLYMKLVTSTRIGLLQNINEPINPFDDFTFMILLFTLSSLELKSVDYHVEAYLMCPDESRAFCGKMWEIANCLAAIAQNPISLYASAYKVAMGLTTICLPHIWYMIHSCITPADFDVAVKLIKDGIIEVELPSGDVVADKGDTVTIHSLIELLNIANNESIRTNLDHTCELCLWSTPTVTERFRTKIKLLNLKCLEAT